MKKIGRHDFSPVILYSVYSMKELLTWILLFVFYLTKWQKRYYVTHTHVHTMDTLRSYHSY